MKKKIFIFIFICLMVFPIARVRATTVQDLYNQLADLESKQAKANSDKKLTNDQIKTLNNEINSIADSIKTTKATIAKAQNDIVSSNQKIEDKRLETNELLRFLQISSGENVYLKYLFEAEDYTDFIYRYSVVAQMSDYNTKLTKELEQLVNELEKSKVELAAKEKSLESQRISLTSKSNTLRANLSELTELGTTIEQDIKDLKKDINYYVNELGCSKNQDITTCSKTPYAKGWKYPMVTGCVTSEYTGYEERPDWVGGGHHAIDLSCVPEGTKIYAAAAGTVARVVWRSSCGGNMVWIYHTVNGQAYTTVYMHLLSISVSERQVVSDTTVIGGMGGGSTASYDDCTGGAHLHFGLANGHNAYNFNAYSFNPRNIFTFPSMYGGYFYR